MEFFESHTYGSTISETRNKLEQLRGLVVVSRSVCVCVCVCVCMCVCVCVCVCVHVCV